MSSDKLWRAAESLRRQNEPFLTAVAEWMEATARESEQAGSHNPPALAAAESWLSDPGDLPAVPE